MAINKVVLVGNLGGDPEIKEISDGVSVANFSVATTDRGYTKRDGTEVAEQTEWHNIVAWRGLAKFASYLKKGQKIYIEGKLTTRSWEDESGNKRYKTEVLALAMEGMANREEQAPPVATYTPQVVSQETPPPPTDDLPF